MKLPHLPILAATAASLAMVIGMAATAASAATAPATHAPGVTAPVSARPQGHMMAPVTGTFHTTNGRGRLTGSFTPKKFTVANGVLEATGLLNGKLIAPNGTKLGKVHKTITMPLDTKTANARPMCNILNLRLGPLNLNLLGLKVHLNRVHLTITAIPGAGNLLGNLLCRIANLLNGSGNLSRMAALLNKALTLL